MQGRYSADLVAGDEYLLNLTRYVHLNPVFVRSGRQLPLKERRAMLRAYRWSSYRGYVGKEAPREFMDMEPVMRLIGGEKRDRQANYRKYVETGLAETDEEFKELLKASRWGIGDKAFTERIRALHQDLTHSHKRQEDVAFRRQSRRVPVDQILSAVCTTLEIDDETLYRQRKDSMVRPIAASALCRYGGLSQREVAEVLGIRTGAAVSIQLRRLRESMDSNRGMKRCVNTLFALLEDLANVQN
ncbi:MAG: hypothetical protein O3A51_12430 [Verrucomicrobia bacterium]|nr:hypothetical protein [Verrucomicrobiota bacterium]